MKFSEFVYKRTDVDEVRNRIREITEELKHASSLEEQIQAVYKMNEVEKEISTADSLVYIRYTINTKNEFYAKEREYNDRISPMLEEEFQKYNEVLLQSRFRRELEEKFGKVLFLNLEPGQNSLQQQIPLSPVWYRHICNIMGLLPCPTVFLLHSAPLVST